MSDKGHPELPVLSVTQDNGVIFRNEVGIDIKYDESTLSNYKVVHPFDFVISLRSFQGGFELSDKLGITSPAYTIFTPNYSENHSNFYWATFFKTFKFIESLKMVTFGIRDGKSISFKEFGDLKLNYPNSEIEQFRIGNFFNNLNKLITVTQRKSLQIKQKRNPEFTPKI
ncbi:restriction endonuclease subunit S [Weissella hellenica]|nr:restriction endonuclease subunit S [Weissella hellenica]